MEYEDGQQGRIHRVVALAIAGVLLVVFTVFTIGMTSKSAKDLVREVAKGSEFAYVDRFIILPKNFGQSAGQNFAQKLRSYTDESVICSASDKQFDSLLKSVSLKTESFTEGGRTILFVEVGNDVSDEKINAAYATDGNFEVKCKSVDSTKFFFFQTSPQLSSIYGAS